MAVAIGECVCGQTYAAKNKLINLKKNDMFSSVTVIPTFIIHLENQTKKKNPPLCTCLAINLRETSYPLFVFFLFPSNLSSLPHTPPTLPWFIPPQVFHPLLIAKPKSASDTCSCMRPRWRSGSSIVWEAGVRTECPTLDRSGVGSLSTIFSFCILFCVVSRVLDMNKNLKIPQRLFFFLMTSPFDTLVVDSLIIGERFVLTVSGYHFHPWNLSLDAAGVHKFADSLQVVGPACGHVVLIAE